MPPVRAVVQARYGNPSDVLGVQQVEAPALAADGVLVRVDASSVTGDDWQLTRGVPLMARSITGLRRPKARIPGRDVAGVVIATGSRVTSLRPGDRVFGWCHGALAEVAAATESSLVEAPAQASTIDLATVPTSAVTALQALRSGRSGPGKRVLIVGASGAIGTFAVQIAAASGAYVTAVCGDQSAELVLSLGAQRAMTDRAGDVAAAGERHDTIIDLVGSVPLRTWGRATVRGGTVVVVSSSGGRLLNGAQRFLAAALRTPFSRRRYRPLFLSERLDDLITVAEMLEARAITPVVSHTYPLEGIAAAVEHFLPGRGRGVVAIRVTGRSGLGSEPSPGRPARALRPRSRPDAMGGTSDARFGPVRDSGRT